MGITGAINKMLIVEEVDSRFNGKLRVTKDPVWGTYISAQTTEGWLTQSGGVARSVWKSALGEVKNSKFKIKNCLILGLGGGSIAQLVRKRWPEAEITGVDIDEVFVSLGKKYLKLDEQEVKIVIADAFDFVTVHCTPNTVHYNLICVDTYCGDEFPGKLESEKFIKEVKKILADGGIAIFNRLYYGGKRDKAHEFGKLLEAVFTKVERVYPEANVMFLASA